MTFPAHRQQSRTQTLLLLIVLFVTGLLYLPLLAQNRPSVGIGEGIESRDPGIADILIHFSSPVVVHAGLRRDLPKPDKGFIVYDRLRRNSGESQATVRALLTQRGISFRAFVVSNAIYARVPAGLVAEIASLPGVVVVTHNTPFRVDAVSVHGDIAQRSAEPEWGITHIRADEVWDLGFRGEGVVIGGQDTGFDWTHPAIRASYRGTVGDSAEHHYHWHDAIHEINPLNNDTIVDPSNNPCGLDSPVPCDDNGHGTHTMGTMAGLDGDNIIGVAPGAQWIACRNMERGWGTPATYLECLEWFLAPTDSTGQNPDPAMAPHVINNSWACPPIEGCNPDNFELLREAVENLRQAGIVVVVSAGNSGSGCATVSSPLAIFEESFVVGAINTNDTIANFSSRGPVEVDGSGRLKPDITAPGVQVRSAWRNHTYRNLSGTSMAGPHVAGVVALMISANPALAGQVETIEEILKATARPKTTLQDCGEVPGSEPVNHTFGYGVIDALAAVEAAIALTSIDEVRYAYQSADFRIFPNPAADVVHITSNAIDVLTGISVLNAQGIRILRWNETVRLPAAIGIGALPPGLYFVQPDGHVPLRMFVQ